MAKTTNINLNLTEDENTSFVDWRKSIDGNNDSENKSNMQIIDEKIGDHETRITTLESAGGSSGGLYIVTYVGNNSQQLIQVYSSEEVTTLDRFRQKFLDPYASIENCYPATGYVADYSKTKYYPVMGLARIGAAYTILVLQDNALSTTWTFGFTNGTVTSRAL